MEHRSRPRRRCADSAKAVSDCSPSLVFGAGKATVLLAMGLGSCGYGVR